MYMHMCMYIHIYIETEQTKGISEEQPTPTDISLVQAGPPHTSDSMCGRGTVKTKQYCKARRLSLTAHETVESNSLERLFVLSASLWFFGG